MNVFKLFFISNVLLLISACSQLLLITSAGETQLEQLLTEQRYQQALQLIDNNAPEHPEHLQLLSRRDDIVSQQQQHIDKTIKQSRRLIQQKQWPQANQLLEENLAKNSHNSALQQALNTLQQQRQRFVHQQQLTLAEHNANTLATTLYITEQLLLAEPENTQLLTLQQQTIKKINSTANYLEQQVNTYINKRLWIKSRRYLNAHQKLKGPNSLPEANRLLEQQQKKTLHQQQRKSAHNDQRLRKEQQQALQNALTNQDWSQVHQLLEILQPSEKQPATGQLIEETKQKIQQLSSVLIEEGQKHYAQGRIDQAITSWEQALTIKPDNNNLKERLQRALRFQNNIEKLQ